MTQESQNAGRGYGAKLGAVVLVGGWVAACAPLQSTPPNPQLHLPAGYGADAPSAPAVTVPRVAWQDFAQDPALRSVLAQALAHNRDLRAAVLRVQEARAAYGIQRADRLPTVGVSLEAARAQVPHDLNVTGRTVLGNQFQAGVGFASWELDLWGRIASLNEAALQNFLATDAARRGVTLSVLAQTANSYLTLRELDERLTLAQRTAASRDESLRIFRRREALGAASKLELTQVELLQQQAQALVMQLTLARAQQAHALVLLMGSPLPDDWSASAAVAPPLVEVQPGLPSDLLLQRPDIVAAEHALRAAHANVSAARAHFFPRIGLTASYGTASAELDGLFKAGSTAWNFAPNVSLPLFDGGRRQAALDVAEVRSEQAVVRYEQAVEGAFRDVADALAARRWLGEQVRLLEAMQTVQAERARLAKLRYDSGAARYLEVLDAERDLLAVQQQVVQTQRVAWSAQVALYAALGGATQPDAADAGP